MFRSYFLALKSVFKSLCANFRFAYNHFNISSNLVISSALKRMWRALYFPWFYFFKKVQKKREKWRWKKSTSLLLKFHGQTWSHWIPPSSPMLNMQIVFCYKKYFGRIITFPALDWRQKDYSSRLITICIFNMGEDGESNDNKEVHFFHLHFSLFFLTFLKK